MNLYNKLYKSLFITIQRRKKLQETTQDVKQNVKDEELIPEKIEVPIYQNFLIVFIFLLSEHFIRNRDIYPTTNICKAIICASRFIYNCFDCLLKN